MITINLLPISAFKQKLKGRIFLVSFVLLMLVGLAGIFSVKSFILDEKIQAMKTQSSQLQAELAKLSSQVAVSAQQTDLTVKKWKQLAAVMELEERRRDQTRLLAEIERLVPKDSAWLIDLNHQKGLLTLKGASKDKDTISQLLNRLQNASYLERTSVYLGEINQNMRINNMVLTSFTISARTKFPQPTILESGMEQYKLPSVAQFAETVKNAAPDLATGLLPEDKK